MTEESRALIQRAPAELDTLTVGKLIAQSGYFSDAKDQAQAVVKILAGQEVGIGPIAAMMGIYIVQGRPAYSANLIGALIKRSRRYDYRVAAWTNQICTLVFFENGEQVGESSFSIEDANRAELTTGRNAHSWKHYGRNMLFARALTNGARMYCPDVSSGIPLYTPEELDAPINGATGAVIEHSASPRRDDVEPETGEVIGHRAWAESEIIDAEAIPFDAETPAAREADSKSAGAPGAPGVGPRDSSEHPAAEPALKPMSADQRSAIAALCQRIGIDPEYPETFDEAARLIASLGRDVTKLAQAAKAGR